MENVKKSGVEAALAAAKEFGEVEVIDLVSDGENHPAAGKAIFSVPNGRELQSAKNFLDEYLPNPERKKGFAALLTLDSFIDHANRFKDGDSAIFAATENRLQPQMICVLDYHEKGTGKARFGEHRGVYSFPISDEWKAWTAKREPMNQATFAEFLEERIVDVLDPATVGDKAQAFADRLGLTLASPNRLLELSRGLSIRVDQNVTQAISLSSGEMQIGFEEKHSGPADAPLKIPGGFCVGISVFRGGPLYRIPVRLRYRLKEGKVSWWLACQNVDRIYDDAVGEACSTVVEKTKLPLFFGRPE